MLFKRSKREETPRPYPGTPRALDGRSAALAVEAMACDVVVSQDATADAAAVAARVSGASAAGLRAAGVVESLTDIHASLSAAAGKRLTSVYHLTCHTMPRHTGALHGSHDDYFAAADAGLFQFFARGAQEVADFALIARAVAERSLTPGLVAQDYYRTSHSVQTVALPEPELVEAFAGRPGDTIDAPTPAQEVLFGKTRRRVPRIVDVDHPAGVGGYQDSESYFKALAAQRTYFAAHLAGMIAEELDRYEELTGRRYAEAVGYRVDDADVVVLAQGAVLDELEAAADYVREHEKIRAGVVDLAVFRPFPGAAVANLLRGKRVVTVLERTDRPLSETLPLTAEVRAAVDRAVENGAVGEPVHAGYEPYRPGERPRVLTGVYGVGGNVPSFAELVAVLRNMNATPPKALYYVGLGEDATIRRFPHLHSLQQQLNRDYPSRNETALAAAAVDAPRADGESMRLYSVSVQGGLFAGNLFARVLAEDAECAARTFPHGGLEESAHTATLTTVHADGAEAPRAMPHTVATVLVAASRLVEDVSSRDDVAEGGTLIVGTERDAAGWWSTLSRRTARWIKERRLRVITLDTARIAAETASKPATVDQLAIWALIGAYASLRFPPERVDQIVAGVRERLAAELGAKHYLVGDVDGAIRRGANGVSEVDWSGFDTEDLPAASDGEAPWTVKDVSEWDASVLDVTRFWHSVGYLYDSGQSDRALADPYIATGYIPARSSAFRDMSPQRLRVPDWLPENCTGCGDCWSMCPDSALPPSITSISALVDTSMALAEKAGTALVQMRRFSGHIAKQAYKIYAGDGLHRYLHAGDLLDDAFAQIADKLGLDADKRAALEGEFAAVREQGATLEIAKTERFFDEPHAAAKGSGALLSIALNPLACTGCGVCVDVCPEDALDWAAQTSERLDDAHRAWAFQSELPAADRRDIDALVTDDDASHVYRLLDRRAYHTLVGGDGSFPGNSAKTAVRLVAAAVESVMGPRYEAHIARLADLIERLQKRIQGDVSGVLAINDFDDFSRRLDRIGDDVTPESLAAALGEGAAKPDTPRLRRLTALLEELQEQKRLYETGADGNGRARMALVVDSDAARLWTGTYPYNPLPCPWICHTPGEGLAVAAGVRDGIAAQVAREAAACRRAALELDDAWDEATHAAQLASLGEGDLTDDERALIPPVFVLGETGTTPIGDAAALLGGAKPLGMILLDATGPGAGDTATLDASLLSFALENTAASMVQSSIGLPGHLLRRTAACVEAGGPSLVRVFAPDPHRSGIAPEKTAAQAKLAVETRAFPVFSVARGALSLEGNPAPGEAWAGAEVTFVEPSGNEAIVHVERTPADWAVNEARFQSHFRIVPKGELGNHMRTLAEYSALDEEAREGLEPYIHFVGEGRRHVLAIVSPEMAGVARSRQRLWAWLCSLAAPVTAPAAGAVEKRDAEPVLAPPPAAATAPVGDAAVHQALSERLLELSGYSADPDFFKQSLREFVVARNVAASEDDAGGDDASQ